MAVEHDVLCVGAVVADLVAHPVSRLPEAGESARTGGVELQVGGCAANAAVGLARLGHRVSLASSLGDDVLGRFLHDQLKRERVGESYLSTSASTPTGATLVINVEDEDRRFISAVGANDDPWPEKISSEAVASAKVVSVHGFGLARRPSVEDVERIFTIAREQECLTLLDVIAVPGDDLVGALKRILPLTDVFMPNDDEGRRVTALDDPVEQAAALRDFGAETVVVTCGERGLVAVTGDGTLSLPAAGVELVDSTGCGDAFAAGFLHAHLGGEDLEGCLKAGSFLGAACVTATGAIAGLPSVDQLEEFYRTHSLTFEEV
ncbi:MAG TPA: carbohydrate kinase family protein [Planctomycetes bacterium]|nr:carbohydrate kinase family protein [Planctomycetota bacterium]HIN79556.1 carbohydrate kinase family protein [Planctomycetota bacterium]